MVTAVVTVTVLLYTSFPFSSLPPGHPYYEESSVMLNRRQPSARDLHTHGSADIAFQFMPCPSDGSTRLRSFSFAFDASNMVRIRGRDSSPGRAVSTDFFYRIVDTISIQDDALSADSAQILDVDETSVALAMVIFTVIFLKRSTRSKE